MHHGAGGNQLAKAFLMGERVAGPRRPSAASHRRSASQYQVGRFGLRLRDLLHHPNFLRQRRSSVDLVEPKRQNRQQKNRHAEDESEPEIGRSHDVNRRPKVGVVKKFGVEDERVAKVKENTSPYNKMVEASPVRCIQGTL